MTGYRIRPAAAGDVEAIVAMVAALAEHQRAADQVDLTPADLTAALFDPGATVFADVAVDAAGDGEVPVGFALWFRTYSTWTGRHGIYLEDLYVRPEHRGRGIGRALLAELARRCAVAGWSRLEWQVLEWNEPALGFYRALGARCRDDSRVHRLSGAPLLALAGIAANDPSGAATPPAH